MHCIYHVGDLHWVAHWAKRESFTVTWSICFIQVLHTYNKLEHRTIGYHLHFMLRKDSLGENNWCRITTIFLTSNPVIFVLEFWVTVELFGAATQRWLTLLFRAESMPRTLRKKDDHGINLAGFQQLKYSLFRKTCILLFFLEWKAPLVLTTS